MSYNIPSYFPIYDTEGSVVASARGYKTFFFLNSTEHEFILLINVKMPTIVGILTFISRINGWLK